MFSLQSAVRGALGSGLATTERNKSAAPMKEAAAREAVVEGKGKSLQLEVRTFSEAADQFIEWVKGEHHHKPQTWKRLVWRRGTGIKEVSPTPRFARA